MTNSKKATLLTAIVLAGLVVAVCWHAFLHFAFDAGYPSNTFLYRPDHRFTDWYLTFLPVQEGSPLGRESIYFPFAYVPLMPLVGLSADAALALVVALFAIGTFGFCWHWLPFLPGTRRVAVAAVLAFATYPFLFMIDRANLEMFVALFVFGFFVCFAKERYHLSALFLAAAIATKLFPGVLGILLLHRRQYGAAALTATATAAMTLVPAAFFPGGIAANLNALAENQASFLDTFVYSPGTAYFSLSYYSLGKTLVRFFGGDVREIAEAVHGAYIVFSVAFFAVVGLHVYLRERVLWKQAALLCFVMLLLPEISYDYRLIHLLGPVMLFIVAPPAGRDDWLYAIGFGLLLIPKAYAPIGFETTFGVALNPAIMTVMLAHLMWRGWRGPRDQAVPPTLQPVERLT